MKNPRLSFESLPLEVGTLVAMAMVDARVMEAGELHSKYKAILDELTSQKDAFDFDKLCTAIGIALVEHVLCTISGN